MGREAYSNRKDRDGRMSGCQAQIVGGDHTLRIGSASPSSFPHPSHFDASKCFPPCCFLYFPFPVWRLRLFMVQQIVRQHDSY